MAFARPLIPLLRPLAAPRPAASSQLLRFSQCARSRQDAIAHEVSTASTTSPADANAIPTEKTLLPYHITRTPSMKLPVYPDTKRGGNLKQTKVRRISGDTKRLRDDLKEYLGLRDKEIVINPITENIITKGDYKKKIEEFLLSKNF